MTEEQPTIPDNFAIKARFDDFDAFTEAAFQWNLEFNQLDRGAFVGELNQVFSGGVSIGECRFSRRLTQRGGSPPRAWTFGIPVNDAMSYRWRGQEISGDDVIAFDSGIEMDSISKEDFHILAVSIDEGVIESLCEPNEWLPLSRKLGRAGKVRCGDEKIRELRSAAFSLLSAVDLDPSVVNRPGFQAEIQKEFSGLIVDLFNSTVEDSEVGRPAARVRSRALKKALSAIEDRAHEPISMEELYESSEASGRTLRYAFEEAFGISPKAYLQAHRMNQVRRALLNRRLDGEKVSDVANAWGFWHMGQFAADYRKMFGELPTETRKRS